MQRYKRNILRALKKILSGVARFKNLPRSYQCILLIFPSGIGNAVLSLPALKLLKGRYPDARFLGGYCQEPTGDLLRILDVFDDVFCLQPSVRMLGSFFSLKRNKIDLMVCYYHGVPFRTHLYFMLMGVPVRMGFDDPVIFDPEGLNSSLLSHRVPYNAGLPEYRNDLALVSLLPGDVLKQAPLAVDRLYHQKNRACVNIGIHIGMSLKPRPVWPPEKFLALLERMRDEGIGKSYFVFGGKAEQQYASVLTAGLEGRLSCYVGRLKLSETIQRVAEMDLFICNDGGLMHIAAYLGIPTLAIFGPTDPLKNYPVVRDTKRFRLLFMRLPCQPCYPDIEKDCSGAKGCLAGLSVEHVFQNVRHLYEENSSAC